METDTPPPDLDALLRLLKDPARTGQAEFRLASGSYFAAMDIPLVRGRLFDERDTPDAPHAALVSESLARAAGPGQEPIGRRVQFGGIDGDLRVFTTVGVVGDIRERGRESAPLPTFYASYEQRPLQIGQFTVAIQSRQDPESLVAPVCAAIRAFDPRAAPVFHSIDERLASSTLARRFGLLLVAVPRPPRCCWRGSASTACSPTRCRCARARSV